MTRIVHVITALTAGGAEEMLYKLLVAQRDAVRACAVVSLADKGSVGPRIEALGIPVVSLGMRPGRPSAAAFAKLLRLLRRERPEVVQTWMYHADLLGGAAAKLVGIPVVWNVRHDCSRRDKPLTRLARELCSVLSRWVPASVVFNSESAMQSHARAGYAPAKLTVIPNGFDTSRFRPDPTAGVVLRRALGVPDDGLLVGLVARFHPDKDHANFAAAASLVRRRCAAAHFVLVGEGTEWSNPELAALLRGHGLEGSAHLLGERRDVERIYPAFDVACLSSRTESFPNALGEAMACGVTCVSTDCGDVRALVGESGVVVPVGDPVALAEALLSRLALDRSARAALGEAARMRIADRFTLEVAARRFGDVQERARRGPR